MANIIEIHDFSDPALDVYARLTENQLLNRADPDNALFVAESPLVIGRALDAGCEPVSFLMERQHTQGKGREILARCCQDIPVYTADESVLTQLTGFHLTRGMLCAMRRPKLQSVEDVSRDARRGVVRIPLAGHAHIASVRVEDRSGGAVSGLFPFDPATPEIVRNGNSGNLPWVVLDCAGTGGGVRPAASGTEFCVAVPAGDYASGLSVRVTDCAHRSATWEIPGPCAVAAGGVKNDNR